MKILALDTATAACSVALWEDGAIRARRFEVRERGHAEAVMPMVRAVVSEGEINIAAVDLIAVTVGPGAFTGLRIGLSAARGMALAAKLPCLGVTTLEAVAHGIPDGNRDVAALLVVLTTKRDDVYAQVFGPELEPRQNPRVLLPDGLPSLVPPGPVSVAGDAAGLALETLSGAGIAATVCGGPGLPDAVTVAEIAAQRWRPGEVPPPPAPLYLRPPEAKLPKDRDRRT